MENKDRTKLRYRLAEGLELIDTKDTKNTMPKFISHFEEVMNGSKIIFITQTGSVLHGTNSDLSDSDYKGIYIPSVESIVSENYDKVINIKTNDTGLKNGAEDIDMELFSIQNFFEQASGMEANNIEILFSMTSDKVLYETTESKMIRDNQTKFITDKIQGFIGFAMNMAYKYSEKGDRLTEVQDILNFFKEKDLSKSALKKVAISEYENELIEFCKDKEYIQYELGQASNGLEAMYLIVLGKMYIASSKVGYVINGLDSRLNSFGKRAEKAKASGGVDLKAFAHAIRAIRQAKDLLLTGRLEYPIPYAAELKEIKYSETLNKEQLSNMVEEEYQSLIELQESDEIIVPEEVNLDELERLKVNIYNVFILDNLKFLEKDGGVFEVWESQDRSEIVMCYKNNRRKSGITRNSVLIFSFTEYDFDKAVSKAKDLIDKREKNEV